MPFFLDTNLPVGYTVVHDRWHDESVNFFSKYDDDFFWSNFVQSEYFGKLRTIVRLVDFFLKKANYCLKNNSKDFVNYEEFEKYVLFHTRTCELDDFKKIKILEEFWNRCILLDGISSIVYTKFREYSENFEKIYFKRDYKLNEIMILHDCGLDNYLRYYDYALKLFNFGIHQPDCRILVDAYDCGLSHEGLIFVSADDGMLKKISDIDESF